MVTGPGGGGPHSGRKEDHTQGGRRTTLREEGGPHSERKEDHTQGGRRTILKEDYSRGKTTAEGRLHQEEGHSREDTYTHSSWVLVEAVDAGSVVGLVDAVETSVDHCFRTWSSL